EAETLWAHMQGEPPGLPDFPPLDPVLERALAKEKAERYPTCGALVEAAGASLGLETPRVRRRSRMRRRTGALIAVGALVLGGGIAAAVTEMTSSGSAKPVVAKPNSVAAIDPKTDRVVTDVAVGNSPSSVAVGGGAVWVLNADDRTVSRVDLASHAARTLSI